MKRRKHRSRVSFGTVFKILLIAVIAMAAGFAAMLFYLRTPEEAVVDDFLQCIAEHTYEDAYGFLGVDHDQPLLSASHFADYAASFYREGMYDVKRAPSSTKEHPVFTCLSEGTSDRQKLTLHLYKDETDTWKISTEDMLTELSLYVPAEFGAEAEGTVLAKRSDHEQKVTVSVFPSVYHVVYNSDVYQPIAQDVKCTMDRPGDSSLKNEEFVLNEENDQELQAFASELIKVYVEDIENHISVYTVLDPDSVPVYSSEVSALIGDYLGEDFYPGIPWQIELEEGCRASFYNPFPEHNQEIKAEGSFALNKTIADAEQTQITPDGSECDPYGEVMRFTYDVLVHAVYSEDYYDDGAKEVKNSRTSDRSFRSKVTFSRHDGRWWVRNVTAPRRES